MERGVGAEERIERGCLVEGGVVGGERGGREVALLEREERGR